MHVAFEMAKLAPANPDRKVRIACREIFRQSRLLKNLIFMLKEVLSAGEIESPEPYADAEPPAIAEPKFIDNHSQ